MISMKFDVFMYSSRGGRDHNEDCCRYDVSHKSSVFVLADGLGGHDCGEVASEIAVETAISALADNERTDLYSVIADVNREIKSHQQANEMLAGMRTTVVCAKAVEDKMFYANVGDSRFYYFKMGKKLLRTIDHSVPQMSVDMGELDEIGMRYSEDRNKLLKVLGEGRELALPCDYPHLTMCSGDAFLLCSDGFWENIFDMEMEVDLTKSLCAKDWAHYMIKRVLLRVSGQHDNFSLICGMIT